MRQVIESVNGTFKGQLDPERGHNQHGQPGCHYATLMPIVSNPSPDGWALYSTANWWWASNVTLWWNNHHSRSNAGCNVQNAPKLSPSGYWVSLIAKNGDHACIP